MNIDLKGQVAVVTGGSGVLGGSISRSLVENGVKVVILGLHKERVEKTVQELSPLGEVMGIVCNVLDIQSLKEASSKILAKWGEIDILVNVAGGNLPGATLAENQTVFDMKIEDFNRVTDLNLNGTVYPCLVFGKAMADKGKGSIVNISSMATYSSITRVPGYSVAKSGVEIFTKWLAMEMALKFSEKNQSQCHSTGFFYRQSK
jgi:NAD(P)-dependent dehydrogenase (short-subunit alcohol dehydrogenase family)